MAVSGGSSVVVDGTTNWVQRRADVRPLQARERPFTTFRVRFLFPGVPSEAARFVLLGEEEGFAENAKWRIAQFFGTIDRRRIINRAAVAMVAEFFPTATIVDYEALVRRHS